MLTFKNIGLNPMILQALEELGLLWCSDMDGIAVKISYEETGVRSSRDGSRGRGYDHPHSYRNADKGRSNRKRF